MTHKPPQYILDLPIEVRAEMAIQLAAKRVAVENKRMGMPLVLWEHGRPVELPPEQIPDYDSRDLEPYPDVFESQIVGRIDLRALAARSAHGNEGGPHHDYLPGERGA